MRKAIPPDRIASYVAYFYKNHLKKHFEEEEQHIFILVDEKDEKRKKAERQHRKIRQLVKKLSLEPDKVNITLGQIEEALDTHIRFEEREFFPYLQSCLEESTLERLREKIEEIHEATPETWEDQFWEKS